MKTLSILLTVCSIGISTYAATTGVGVFVQQDGGGVSLPIDLANSFRIEPTFEFERFEENNLYGNPSNAEFITTEVGVGTGLFVIQELSELANVYYGARFNYSYSSVERTQPSPKVKSEYNGFAVAPTIGLEYFLANHFSAGAEAGWYFEYIDSVDFGHATDTGNRHLSLSGCRINCNQA